MSLSGLRMIVSTDVDVLLHPWGCECGNGGGHLDGGEHCDSHSSSQTWSSLCHWVQTIPDEMGSCMWRLSAWKFTVHQGLVW